jgi:hypothetical protein
MTELSELEGINQAHISQFFELGITSIDRLLVAGRMHKTRNKLAKIMGVSELKMLLWINRADLARIKGIGWEYAKLLEYAGVDTPGELALCHPDLLNTNMIDVNLNKSLELPMPGLLQVVNWVAQAKIMPCVVERQ